MSKMEYWRGSLIILLVLMALTWFGVPIWPIVLGLVASVAAIALAVAK